jgi:RHH-type transcriptional regulator, rel operon repressor / antitoxin RelB
VAKLYIRIDDSLHERLEQRALGAGLSISDLVRPLLEDAAAPGGTYIYTAHDEILALVIEVYALIATELADRHPDTLRRGTAHGLDMLRHRGLLAAAATAQSGEDLDLASGQEAGR